MSKDNQQRQGRSDAPEPPNGYQGASADGGGSYEPNRHYPDAGMGVTSLTKAGWFALGFFLGIFAPIIVYFLYIKRDREMLFMSLRFVLAGVAAGLVAEFLLVGWLTSTNPELASQVLGMPAGDAGSDGWTSSNF